MLLLHSRTEQHTDPPFVMQVFCARDRGDAAGATLIPISTKVGTHVRFFSFLLASFQESLKKARIYHSYAVTTYKRQRRESNTKICQLENEE